MDLQVRPPAVAGYFYPNKPEILLNDIRAYTAEPVEKVRALGCVVPHAGYTYSGHVAGAVYNRIQLPKRFVILCPNHTGRGRPLSIMSGGRWQTPLGDISIDSELALALTKNFSYLSEDSVAHAAEHALEVQLPFLQSLVKHFTFVPVAVGVGAFDVLHGLGEALEATLQGRDDVLIIASSDMNHYEGDAVTRIKDAKAIEKMLALDPRGLYEVVVNEDISMCGFGPAVAMLTAARALGAQSAELVKYATSGDITGDRQAVVGYAGILVR